jgi:apolipoprotein N-acyltransferase
MKPSPDTCVSGHRARRFAPARSLIAACIAGLFFSLATPPFEWSWLAWLVPGLLLVSVATARPLHAYLCGTAYAVVIASATTSWAAAAALQDFDSTWIAARLFILGVHVINPGVPCGLMLAAYVLLRPRLSPAARAPVGATLWMASEFLRNWSAGWEMLGQTQGQLAGVGAVYAMSFVMAMMSIAVAEMIAVNQVWIGMRALRAHLLGPAVAIVALTVLVPFGPAWIPLAFLLCLVPLAVGKPLQATSTQRRVPRRLAVDAGYRSHVEVVPSVAGS